jgi:hypothetical protein
VSTQLILRCLLLATLGAACPSARSAEPVLQPDDVQIKRTFFGWREAASFKRISEYFTGKENTGGEIVLRTHPEQRSGYYFLVRVSNEGAPAAARIALQVVIPGSAGPKLFTFKTVLPAKVSVFDLGLTGADWPDRHLNAVAWRINIIDDSERTLATAKTFLWDKPAGE